VFKKKHGEGDVVNGLEVICFDSGNNTSSTSSGAGSFREATRPSGGARGRKSTLVKATRPMDFSTTTAI
jgi:hypothetical protein